MKESCQLNHHFCGFCGKGHFPTSSGLNKHIRHSLNCNKAAHQKWGDYATNIWDNAPGPSNNKPQPSALPLILENSELVDTLEEDLQGVEHELANVGETQPDTINPPETQSFRATVEDAEDDDIESIHYVEDFPRNLGAGAVWGEEVPFFEKLRQEREKSETSQWAPFEDQDEWELAEWLIKNIGQKQTDAFLNLNIVSAHRLMNFDTMLIVWSFNRH